MTETIATIAGAIIVVSATAVLGLSAIVARKLVSPRRWQHTVNVLAQGGASVILDRDSETASPVISAVRQGDTLSVVGMPSAGAVGSRIIRTGGQGLHPGPGAWDSRVYASAADLGDEIGKSSVLDDGSILAEPAQTSDRGDVVVVHIHGQSGGVASALRGLPAVSRVGYRSLVVSYTGDVARGAGFTSGPFTLGAAESDEVCRKVLAVVPPTSKLVLLGWSMGANIALELATCADLRDRVVGVVLASPVIRWSSTVKHTLASSPLPPWIAPLALKLVDSRPTSTLLGMARPAATTARDFLARTAELREIPILMIHSAGDTVSPITDSVALAAALPLATLVRIADCAHTLEWNRDRDSWEQNVEAFLSEAVSW